MKLSTAPLEPSLKQDIRLLLHVKIIQVLLMQCAKEICQFIDSNIIKDLDVPLALSSDIMTPSRCGLGLGWTIHTAPDVLMNMHTYCFFHTFPSPCSLSHTHTHTHTLTHGAGSHGRRECEECSKPRAGVLTRPRLHAVTAGVCGQTSLCQTHWLQHPPRPAELQLATHN